MDIYLDIWYLVIELNRTIWKGWKNLDNIQLKTLKEINEWQKKLSYKNSKETGLILKTLMRPNYIWIYSSGSLSMMS